MIKKWIKKWTKIEFKMNKMKMESNRIVDSAAGGQHRVSATRRSCQIQEIQSEDAIWRRPSAGIEDNWRPSGPEETAVGSDEAETFTAVAGLPAVQHPPAAIHRHFHSVKESPSCPSYRRNNFNFNFNFNLI